MSSNHEILQRLREFATIQQLLSLLQALDHAGVIDCVLSDSWPKGEGWANTEIPGEDDTTMYIRKPRP